MTAERDVERLTRSLHEALRGQQSSLAHLSTLLVYKDWENEQQSSPPDRLKGFVEFCLRSFQAGHPNETGLLRERFLNKTSIKSLALKIALSEEQVSRRQRQAISTWANWLFAKEWQLARKSRESLENSLPPASYTKLFGLDQIGEKLVEILSDDEHPIVSVVGLGGLGKTALADWATRQLIEVKRYNKIVWIRFIEGEKPFELNRFIGQVNEKLGLPLVAFTDRLRELRRFLKSNRTLIVLDDLDEIGPNEKDIELLHELCIPSKFLFTSRKLPPPLTQVFVFGVRELDLTTAGEFFEYEITARGLSITEDIRGNYFEEIYRHTGGNALAIRLVAGLMLVWSIPEITEGLKERAQGDIDHLYQNIFELSWAALSENAKQTLTSYSLVTSEGATEAQLQAISGLSRANVRSALVELRTRSLLEMSGSAMEPRYGIHQLTRTFVGAQVYTTKKQLEDMVARNLTFWQNGSAMDSLV